MFLESAAYLQRIVIVKKSGAVGVASDTELSLDTELAAVSREMIREMRVWRAQVSSATNYVFFEVETDSGRVGVGEATMSGDDQATARCAHDLFARFADGQSIDKIPRILAQCAAAVGAFPSRVEATAISGVEHCLIDLRAQALGVPLYELLGGAQRSRVPVYANINRGLNQTRDNETFASAAQAAVANGFDTIKIAPFDEVDRDCGPDAPAVRTGMSRVVAVREAVGPEQALLIDCHGRFNFSTCMALLPELDEIGVSWLEEPLATSPRWVVALGGPSSASTLMFPGKPWQELAVIARRSAMPLAGGESEYGVAGFQRVLATGALSFVMPDVKHCGGAMSARMIGDLAGACGVVVAPHNPSGPVATIVSMHVCLATAAFGILEYQWGEVGARGEMVSPVEPLVSGELVPTSEPGLGVSLDHAVIAASALSVERLV